MARPLVHTELWAGGIAAGLLLLLVAVFGTAPWLAILLAVGAYGGVLLTLSNAVPATEPPGDAQLAFAAAQANLESVRKLESVIPDPDVRSQVSRIGDRVSRSLLAMEEDGMLAAAIPLNEHLLEPYVVLLGEYVRLSARDVRSAGDLLRRAETHDFPIIEVAMDSFYEKLNRGNIVDLATQAEMLSLHIESLELTPHWRTRP